MSVEPGIVREQIAIDLRSLVVQARRCPSVTHRFTADPLTEWDRRHADIDALLDSLVGV